MREKNMGFGEIKLPYTIRQTLPVRILVPSCLGFLLSILVYVCFRDGVNDELFPFASGGLLVYLYFISLRGLIKITDESIFFYRSYNIFSKPHKVLFENIINVKAEVKPNFGKGYSFYLYIYEKEKENPFRTIFSGFSKEDQGLLIKLIAQKSLSAEFDETTQNLKKGISPWTLYPL
jgi:hypothetical protein